MARILELPDADHVQYSNAPLKLMLGQVRFPAILKIAAPGGLASFQEEIRKDYSEYAEEQQIGLVISPEGMQPAGDMSRNYRFSTADGGWSIVVNQGFVTLEASIATKYSTYDEFHDRFERAWDAVLRHLEPTRITQQGLRYVDFFDWADVKPDGWDQFISSALLGTLGVKELVHHVEHSVTDVRLKLRDLGFMSLKYGLSRGGPENVLGFLLDTDVFSQVPQETTSVAFVMDRFKAFHEEIHVVFNWATTPAARERFNREPAH